ncbi:MAG: glycerate kinase [Chloroflexi bacterium]|nr:glycerate kinase [Chloroflexota bacterium]
MGNVTRVLICPQEFKGSLSAADVAKEIVAGLDKTQIPFEEMVMPFSDGGPGTVDSFLAVKNGKSITVNVCGPQGEDVTATYALFEAEGKKVAVIEAAAACGLVLTHHDKRNPLEASSYGVGELIAHAIDIGVSEVLIGVGGTGTNDGGTGLVKALGMKLLDENEDELNSSILELTRLKTVTKDDEGFVPEDLNIFVAVDVRNKLLGVEGATKIFGPQKGVQDWQIPAIDAALAEWAKVVKQDFGVDVQSIEGSGAGGGLVSGLLAYAYANHIDIKIDSGSKLVADLVGLHDAISRADLIITGEGTLDNQTQYGKCVGYVSRLAKEMKKPCIAIVGKEEEHGLDFFNVEVIRNKNMSLEESMARGKDLVQIAAKRAFLRWSNDIRSRD